MHVPQVLPTSILRLVRSRFRQMDMSVHIPLQSSIATHEMPNKHVEIRCIKQESTILIPDSVEEPKKRQW